VDSGYATASNRDSSATTASFDTTSSFRRQSEHSLLRRTFQNRFSNTQSSCSRPSSIQPDSSIPDTDHSHGPVDHDDINNQYIGDEFSPGFYGPDHLSHEKDVIQPSPTAHASHYLPPHAFPSRCSRAGAGPEFPDLGLETCQLCNATKLHHLASISRRTDVSLFKEVVRSNLASINASDNEGNLCVHFAAGSGASLDQLAILERAGADVSRQNNWGQSFLHLLDPQLYGRTMPAVIGFAVQHGLSLSQRDCDGKTPLHHMFGRTITLTNVHDLIPFLQLPGRAVTFMDRHGNTPLDILRQNWEEVNNGVHLAQLEAKLIACNVPLAFRPVSNGGPRPPSSLLDVSNLPITTHDETSTSILNIINRSLLEPYYQDSSAQNVLHALAAFSFHANYQLSCYLTPIGLLECLQHRLRNRVNVGLDVNQYNSDGFTPLHSFLTAEFDINLDISWLVPECVELLLESGADPTLRNRDGNTALHLACSRGRFGCAGKIVRHLSGICGRQQYIQCLSAVNDQGKTVVEQAQACMNSETLAANERRKQCIGLVRAALGEPMYSYMPAAYASAANSSTLTTSAMTWSAQLPNHARSRASTSPARPHSGYRKGPSWPLRISSLQEPEAEMRSAFED
jgi:Ankyrin repeats (many copies)